ncbi:MAG: prolipoprotein diacylglyceryl transferase [Clostridiales bacterium]|nr:prolipoprotein diacylglyceryl transferase [Clostridiales bacterium]
MNFDEVRFPFLGFTVNVDPVAFSIGSFNIYWYGVIISLAMVLCGVLAVRQAKRNKFSEDLVYDILLVSLPSAIIGARLYYVLCEWDYYSQDLSRIFDTRSGGLAVYGGVLGAFLGAFIMTKIRKISFSTCADYCVVYIPLGQAIGRWGNFFNQEAFGTTTTLPWGMTSEKISRYLASNCPELDASMPVHPTFLYESLCTLTIFIVLLLVRSISTHRFETTSVYMILYGAVRFFLEGLRTDSLYLGSTGIRTSQLLSVILVVGGLVIILVSHLKDWERLPLPANSSRKA